MSTTQVMSGPGPVSSNGQPQFGQQPQPMALQAMVPGPGGQLVPHGAQMVAAQQPQQPGGLATACAPMAAFTLPGVPAPPGAPMQMVDALRDANPDPDDEDPDDEDPDDEEPDDEQEEQEPEQEPAPEPEPEPEPAAEPEPEPEPEPAAMEPEPESLPAAESADADASAPADAPLEAAAPEPDVVAEPPADSPLLPTQPPEPLPA